ncbi:MAG: fatty acid desaturase family protein, partial [Armatimonadota bacterium]
MTTLKPVSHKEYVAVLRPLLPDHIFKPVPHRLLWMLPHGLVIAGGIFAIVNGLGGIVGKLIAAILIGNSFTALGFLGHEIMHGAVTRKKWLQYLTAGICFSPFWVGPLMWRLWHNVQHHVHTQHPDKDPDTSATYDEYQRRPALQWLYRLVRRNGTLFFAMLCFWFTMHSSQ